MDSTTSFSEDEEERYSFSSDVQCDSADLEREKEITALLAAAGPVGVAAAAAIMSTNNANCSHSNNQPNNAPKRKIYSFETNPSKRKRQQNRLLRKLKRIIQEFGTRIGKQIVVLVATPNEGSPQFNCFGTRPLENVMVKLKDVIIKDLENSLFNATPPVDEVSDLFELPPLMIDGIPTPLEKMTQGHLRAFIPMMLKFSTGRSKPGWGKENMKPPWWPNELPWANVRMDSRNPDDKLNTSWTTALRQIIINCYRYHGRDDLLKTFPVDEDEKENKICTWSTSTETALEDTTKIVLEDDTKIINEQQSSASTALQVDNSTMEQINSAYQLQIIKTDSDGQEQLIDISSLSQVTFNSDNQIIFLTGDNEQTTFDSDTQFVSFNGGESVVDPLKQMFALPVVTSIQQVPATNTDGALCYAFVQIPSKVKDENDDVDDLKNLINCDNYVDTSIIHESEGVVPQLVQVVTLNEVN